MYQLLADVPQVSFSLSQPQALEHTSQSQDNMTLSNIPSEPATLPDRSQDASTSSKISKIDIWNHFENFMEDSLGKLDENTAKDLISFLRVVKWVM